MEDLVEQGMLYDCYGTLLTPHQQKVFEMVVYEDLSLNEIAERTGVSRQAVSDLVRRVSAQLELYERKLGLAERSRRLRRCCDGLDASAGRLAEEGNAEATVLREYIGQIRREL